MSAVLNRQPWRSAPPVVLAEAVAGLAGVLESYRDDENAALLREIERRLRAGRLDPAGGK